MRKLPLAAALVAVALSVSGCSTQEALDKIGAFLGRVNSALVKAQDTIREGCATVAAYEMQAEALAAATGSCKARNAVEKVRVTITGICNNTAQITDAQAGNYVKTIGAAVKQAQSAVAAGC